MATVTVTTETQVANMALQRIGEKPITDIDSPGTDEAALAVDLIFADTRDEVCRSFPWTSISARTALSTSTATASPYSYKHTLTTPMLYVFEVIDPTDDSKSNIKYQIEGTTLYTNESTGQIRYIAQTATVATWDPLLLEAIVTRLASKLAIRLSGDLQLAVLMQREYMAIIGIAMATKAIEGRQDDSNDGILALLDRQVAPLLYGKQGNER